MFLVSIHAWSGMSAAKAALSGVPDDAAEDEVPGDGGIPATAEEAARSGRCEEEEDDAAEASDAPVAASTSFLCMVR